MRSLSDHGKSGDPSHVLLNKTHAEVCVTSCHKCLRNYSNRLIQHKLNWRLAIDLFRLMRDQVEIGVFGSHWHYLIRESIPKRLEGIWGLELVPEVVVV